MSAKPTVSVLLAVRNQARWLPAALGDILGQTWTDLELIAVDDESTDGSTDILKAVRDPRLRWFSLKRLSRRTCPNGYGLPRALNFAICQARGQWLARQDSDDRCVPTRLAEQMAYLRRHPKCALLGSDTLLIDDDDNPLTAFMKPRLLDHAAIRSELLLGENPIVHGSAVVHAEVVRKLSGYRLFTYCEDYDLWLRLTRDHQAANLPEKLYVYRVHRGQVSQQTLRQRRAGLTARALHAHPSLRDCQLTVGAIESFLTPYAVSRLPEPVRRHWANWFLTWLIGSRQSPPSEILTASVLSLMLDPKRLRTWRAVAGAAWRRLKVELTKTTPSTACPAPPDLVNS